MPPFKKKCLLTFAFFALLGESEPEEQSEEDKDNATSTKRLICTINNTNCFYHNFDSKSLQSHRKYISHFFYFFF